MTLLMCIRVLKGMEPARIFSFSSPPPCVGKRFLKYFSIFFCYAKGVFPQCGGILGMEM